MVGTLLCAMAMSVILNVFYTNLSFLSELYRKDNLKALVNSMELKRHPKTYSWILNNISPLISGAVHSKKLRRRK
jgi:hypothetical protein